MKIKRHFLMSLTALTLALVTGCCQTLDGASKDVKVRTAHLSVPTQYTQYFEQLFDEDNTYLTEDDENVFFYGYCVYDGYTYECYLNTQLLEFELVVNGVDTITTPAYINEDGGIGAYLCEDPNFDPANYVEPTEQDEPVEEDEDSYPVYKLDDYKELTVLDALIEQGLASNTNQQLDETLFGLFACIFVVIFVYVVVAETAEQIRAEKNKTDNENFELANPTLVNSSYIYNQHVNTFDVTAGEEVELYSKYQYGFATLNSYGCGIIAVYNAMISLGSPETLPDVIYDFEKWAIGYSVGFGYLGSNPRHLYRYLLWKNVPYTRFISEGLFINAVQNAPVGANIIMSIRYAGSLKMHIFFVKKVLEDDSIKYLGYNYDRSSDSHPSERNDIDGYINANRFVAGYILN